MRNGSGVQQALLNALPGQVAVLDADGVILDVNDAWRAPATADSLHSPAFGIGQNYIAECEAVTGAGSGAAREAAVGIRRVLRHEIREFAMEYACHSPVEQRWFRLTVTCMRSEAIVGAVLTHVNITESRMRELAFARAEQASRASEARLSFALDAAKLGDWNLDLRTNEAFRSPRHDECFGYTTPVSEWSYDTFLAHVDSRDRLAVDACFTRALAGQGEYDVEFRTTWPDGSQHWLWTSGRVSFDETGVPTRVGGIVANVTERRQAEFQLRQSEANLSASQRIAHLGSWELDLVDVGDLAQGALRWSDEVFRIWGYEPGGLDVTYNNFLAAVHPADRGLIADAVAAALRDSQSYDLVHRIIRPDGMERVVREQAEFMFNEGTDQALRMIGTVMDITEQHAADTAMLRVLERLNEAQRIGQIGDWEWNSTTQDIAWSPQVYEIVGRDPTRGPPRDFDEQERSYDAASRVVQLDRVTEALATGVGQAYELMVVRPTGERVPVQVLALPRVDAAGKIVGLHGVVQDISARKRAEASLADSQQRLALATKSAHLGIWDWHVKTDSMLWNAQMFSLYGMERPEAEIAVNTWLTLVHPEDRSRARAVVTAALEDRKGFHMDYRVVWPDGEVHCIEVRALVHCGDDRSATRMIGVSMDITERKNAELASRLLTAIVDSSEDAIIGIDLAAAVTSWNRGAEKIFGYSAMEMVGQSILTIIPADRQSEELYMLDTIARGESVTHFETLRTTKDGHVINVSITASPIRDSTGAIIGVSKSERDITERARADARIRRLMESKVQGVFFWDAEGALTEANDAFLQMVGYTRDDLAAGRLTQRVITPPEYEDLDRHAFAEIAATGASTPFEKEFTRKDGSRVSVLYGVAAFEDILREGVCFAIDLTERKKLEQQFLRAQRVESIGAVAGGIAHDLNNALTPITMAADLLQAAMPDGETQELLDVIRSSAERGADMVRQVLSFAKGNQGQRVKVQMGHLIKDIEKIARDTFLKRLQVRTSVPNDLGAVVGDPTQLHQVLMNLCVNARDAMPAGGTLTINAENVIVDAHDAGLSPDAKPGPYVLVEVADTGTGMTPELIGRIFDPFFSTKGVNQGTGLGLSTSMAIVKGHGGFIRVESAPAVGSTFKVFLPAQANALRAAEPPSTEMPRGNGELILVVDDEPSVRTIAKQTLVTYGYTVLLADDGADAVATFTRRSADIAVVLTDMTMPVMDGPTTIRALRQIKPEVRIIGTSGLLSNSNNALVASLGIRHFLPKPYTADALLNALRQTLTEDVKA